MDHTGYSNDPENPDQGIVAPDVVHPPKNQDRRFEPDDDDKDRQYGNGDGAAGSNPPPPENKPPSMDDLEKAFKDTVPASTEPAAQSDPQSSSAPEGVDVPQT